MAASLFAALETTFDDAVERTTNALAEQGFGVLTTIDIAATLKKKIDIDMERYVILGACNPGFAGRALDIDRHLGQLLPCNVVVRADPNSPESRVLIEAMDPQLMVQFSEHAEELAGIADEVSATMRAAIQALGTTSASAA